MASIAKLSIRGVRAFSPNDDEQVIGFCFPLTIIVVSVLNVTFIMACCFRLACYGTCIYSIKIPLTIRCVALFVYDFILIQGANGCGKC